MLVRIYKRDKTAMQSGRGKTGDWIVESAAPCKSKPSGIMGWSGGGTTSAQICLNFDSQEAAIAYAVQNGLSYNLLTEHNRHIKPKAYADNFKFDRLKPWTH